MVILKLCVHPLLKCLPVFIRPLLNVKRQVFLLIPGALGPHQEERPLLFCPVFRFVPHPPDHLPLRHLKAIEIFQAFVVFPLEILPSLSCKKNDMQMCLEVARAV